MFQTQERLLEVQIQRFMTKIVHQKETKILDGKL